MSGTTLLRDLENLAQNAGVDEYRKKITATDQVELWLVFNEAIRWFQMTVAPENSGILNYYQNMLLTNQHLGLTEAENDLVAWIAAAHQDVNHLYKQPGGHVSEFTVVSHKTPMGDILWAYVPLRLVLQTYVAKGTPMGVDFFKDSKNIMSKMGQTKETLNNPVLFYRTVGLSMRLMTVDFSDVKTVLYEEGQPITPARMTMMCKSIICVLNGGNPTISAADAGILYGLARFGLYKYHQDNIGDFVNSVMVRIVSISLMDVNYGGSTNSIHDELLFASRMYPEIQRQQNLLYVQQQGQSIEEFGLASQSRMQQDRDLRGREPPTTRGTRNGASNYGCRNKY